MAVFAMLFLFACSPDDAVLSDMDASSQDLVARIGQVNNQGQAEMNISTEKLEAAFVETYQLQSASDMQIVENEVGYFLQGRCIIDENVKVTFAIALELDQNDQLKFGPAASTQGCTSSTGCKGCKLTTVSNNAGYCDCIASDVWVDPSKGKCIHSIEVIATPGKANFPQGPLTPLVQNIMK